MSANESAGKAETGFMGLLLVILLGVVFYVVMTRIDELEQRVITLEGRVSK